MIECISMILVGVSAFIAGFLGMTWLEHVCDHRLVLGKTEDDYVEAYKLPTACEILKTTKLFKED